MPATCHAAEGLSPSLARNHPCDRHPDQRIPVLQAAEKRLFISRQTPRTASQEKTSVRCAIFLQVHERWPERYMYPDGTPANQLRPPDAQKRGLHRTMPFTISETAAAEEAGFNTRKVRFDPKSPVSAIAVHNAAPSTFTTFCTGLRKVATVGEAVRAGFDAMEAGADGVLCQWGPDFIRAVRGGCYCRRMTARLADHRAFTRGLCCKSLLRQLI